MNRTQQKKNICQVKLGHVFSVPLSRLSAPRMMDAFVGIPKSSRLKMEATAAMRRSGQVMSNHPIYTLLDGAGEDILFGLFSWGKILGCC